MTSITFLHEQYSSALVLFLLTVNLLAVMHHDVASMLSLLKTVVGGKVILQNQKPKFWH